MTLVRRPPNTCTHGSTKISGHSSVLAILSVGVFCIALACSRGGGSGRDTTAASSSTSLEQSAESHLVVAGDSLRFMQHVENLPAGFPSHAKSVSIKNPYEGDKGAIATGGKLFVAYNCSDCHGADGSGSMAPTFQDNRWHFGGAPGEVFESIYEGRPDGMPSWGGRITDDQIWMLTAYVRSLASKDLSTENFTGKTVERTGH
jgi:mono/diheme cytochrome c family protein